MDLLVSLPWWAGVAVGLVGFAVIRWGVGAWFAASGGQLGKAIGAQLGAGALGPLAWMFLGLCCLAALFSKIRSRQRARLLDSQQSIEAIRSMSWQAFERLVGEAYRRQGYAVTETGQGGADGGVDLLLRRDGRTTLVQCKHWRSQRVGVSVVREMYGLLAHHGADAVKIVCTGVFTSECEAFVRGKPMELVDGPAVLALVQSVQGPLSRAALAPSAKPIRVEPPAGPATVAADVARACPKCSQPMVQRTNRTNGDRFWGCSGYPKCRGTAPA
jgi:restriction system protein